MTTCIPRRILQAIGLLLAATVSCGVHRGAVPDSSPSPDASQPFPVSLAESPYRNLDGLPEGTILHLPTGVQLTKEQTVTLLASARIVYVGEAHDNLKHHRIQLEILRALADRSPGHVAVGMEMFQRPAQPQLDRWSRGDLDEHAFLTTWYENWSEDYDYYREILEFIRDRHIPLLALNAPEHAIQDAADGHHDASSQEQQTPVEIDATDPFHRRQMEAVFGGHAKGAGFDAFYRAMLIWDETMAQTVADYVSSPSGRDKTLLVFAGGGHLTYGFGIPRRAFRRAPLPYVIVLPHTDIQFAPNRPDATMDVDSIALPLLAADIVWATGYEDLEATKVRLGVRVERNEDGVLVTDVAPDSAALRAGIHVGDVIVSFDGEPVRQPIDLVRSVRSRKPGDHAIVTIRRDSHPLTIDVFWPP